MRLFDSKETTPHTTYFKRTTLHFLIGITVSLLQLPPLYAARTNAGSVGGGSLDGISSEIDRCGLQSFTLASVILGEEPEEELCDDPDDDEANPHCELESLEGGDGLFLDPLTGSVSARLKLFNLSSFEPKEFGFHFDYNSRRAHLNPQTPFGVHLSHLTYLEPLNPRANSPRMRWIDQTGRRHVFSGHLFMGPIRPSGRNHTKLSATPEGLYEVEHQGVRYRFHSQPANPWGGIHQVDHILLPTQQVIRFEYDELKQLRRVISPFGRTIEYDWNNGQISEVRGPSGQRYTFETEVYDEVNQRSTLTRIVDHATGGSHHYQYQLIQNGPNTAPTPQLIEETLPDGRSYYAEYSDQSIRLLDSLNSPIIQTYSSRGFPKTLQSPSAEGRVVATDGVGNQTRYTRDKFGRVTEILNPDSSRKVFTYGTSGNSLHQLVSITDENAFTKTYEYNARNQVYRVTDALGNQEYWFYENHVFPDLITRKEKPGGREERFFYNDRGETTLVINALGLQTRLERTYYENTENLPEHLPNPISSLPGRLKTLTLTDPQGRQSRVQFDGSGNLLKIQRDPSGLNLETQFIHDASGLLTELRIPNSGGDQVTQIIRDEAGRIEEVIQDPNGLHLVHRRLRNASGAIIEKLSPRGIFTSFTYDHRGRLIQTVKGTQELQATNFFSYNGNSKVTRYQDAAGRILDFEYNARSRLTEIRDALYKTRFTYDPVGNLLLQKRLLVPRDSTSEIWEAVAYTYDALGRLTSETKDPAGLAYTKLYEYASPESCACSASPEAAKPSKVTDAGGKVTRLEYDKLDRLVRMIQKVHDLNDDDADEDDRIISWIFNGMDLVELQGPEGEQIIYNYDSAGRLSSFAQIQGEDAAETHIIYDSTDNIIERRLPNGHIEYRHYDAINRLIQVVDGDNQFTHLQYDTHGNLIRKEQSTAQGVRSVEWQHDSLDRVVRSSSSTGEDVDYVYSDNQLLEMIRDNQYHTKMGYDALGRLDSVIENFDPLAPSNDRDKNILRSVLYDGANRAIEKTDHFGNKTAFSFNAAGFLDEIAFPNLSRVTFEYDPLGQLIRKRDSRGQEISWTRNDLHQVTSQVSADTELSYTYDKAGRLVRAATNQSSLDFTYDTAGRLTLSRQSLINSPLRQSQSQYLVSPQTNRQLQYPSSESITQVADGRYRLKELTNNLDLQISFDWDNTNKLVAITRAQEVGSFLSYGDHAQISEIEHGSDLNALWHHTYTHNQLGHRIASIDQIDSQFSEVFEHDGQLRLQSFGRGQMTDSGLIPTQNPDFTTAESWTLDAHGNSLSKVHVQGADSTFEQRTHDAMNRIVSITRSGQTHSPSYDLDGNLLTDPSRNLAFSYDSLGRLSRVSALSTQSTLTSIRYDALSRPEIITFHSHSDCSDSADLKVRRVYDGLSFQIIEEYETCGDQTELLARSYIHGAQVEAMIDHTDRGQLPAGQRELLYYLRDAQGNIVGLAKGQQLVESYRYDPYGKTYILSINGEVIESSSFGNPFAFSAQYYDARVGIYYFQYRAYDPYLQRWLQRDPLLYIDGMNPYAYVQGRATEKIDPNGLWGIDSSDWAYAKGFVGGYLSGVFIDGPKRIAKFPRIVKDGITDTMSEGLALVDLGAKEISGKALIYQGVKRSDSAVLSIVDNPKAAVHAAIAQAKETISDPDKLGDALLYGGLSTLTGTGLSRLASACPNRCSTPNLPTLPNNKPKLIGPVDIPERFKLSDGTEIGPDDLIYRASPHADPNTGLLEPSPFKWFDNDPGAFFSADIEVALVRMPTGGTFYQTTPRSLLEQGARWNPEGRGQPIEKDIFFNFDEPVKTNPVKCQATEDGWLVSEPK